MKFRFSSLLVFLLLLASCVSAKERLDGRFGTLPEVDSTLIYEYSDVSSSATGECAGTYMHRWYRTTMDAAILKKLYSDNLTKNGWRIWPEDVVEIWSLETDDGLFRLGIDIFTSLRDISKEQGGYQLPDIVLLETANYPTIYLVTITYMYPSAAKRCFGK